MSESQTDRDNLRRVFEDLQKSYTHVRPDPQDSAPSSRPMSQSNDRQQAGNQSQKSQEKESK